MGSTSPARSSSATRPSASSAAAARRAARPASTSRSARTGGKKMESPHSLKSNEMAEVVFRPQQPLVVDSFKNCEGLSRIAFLDGNTAVMLGKVTQVTAKSAMPVEE